MRSTSPRPTVAFDTAAAMETRSAVPNEPATWLMVFEVLWACWMASLGSELTPQVLSGVMVNWMPMAMSA